MKKIEIRKLNDIIYLKDEKDLTVIVTKLRNKFGLQISDVYFIISFAEKISMYKSRDEKIDYIVRFLESYYNSLVIDCKKNNNSYVKKYNNSYRY